MSIPLVPLPNLCLPTSSILPASYHLIHRYVPHLFPPLQSLPSLQHPERLPSLGYPSLYLLLVKLVKHFRWMLSSSLQWPCHTYLALGGVRIRLTGNGIKVQFYVYYTSLFSAARISLTPPAPAVGCGIRHIDAVSSLSVRGGTCSTALRRVPFRYVSLLY